MISKIDELVLKEDKKNEVIQECIKQNLFNVALLLSKVLNITDYNDEICQNIVNLPEHFKSTSSSSSTDKNIRVLLCCSWTSSEDLCKTWKKMSKNNDNRWNNIQIVSNEPADYYCVINKPLPGVSVNKKKTILFRMEPNMENDKRQWGDEWSNPKKEDFLFLGNHNLHLNNFEWHLSTSYEELLNKKIEKDNNLNNILTTILSDKYSDKGHIKRVDFIKYLEKKGMDVHVYGGNKFLWKNYKGSLPYHKKDESLYPYKYSFNCENHSIKNYCTEKLIDGILSETLVFYSGCYNIKDFINEKAFVYLELSNFEKDYQIIRKAIEEDWWSERLPYIKEAKEKILNEMQFFPRLEKIITTATLS